jgi:uncharacterized membrane protein YedE/YeeE
MKTETDSSSGRLWNPYLAGVVLGLVLLASFVLIGQGLGASGGVGRLVAKTVDMVAPEFAKASLYFSKYAGSASEPLMNYMVFLGIGVLLGGFIAALSGGRIDVQLEKGPRATTRSRIALALLGGAVMGFAARLAYGCTSGQALSGGAALAAGSWAFMLSVFAGGYALAWFIRRQWI